MLPRDHPDRIDVAFDDHRLVANAGLLLPPTLSLHLGLPQLVDRHLDLGDGLGRANTGDKMMTLVASAPRPGGGNPGIGSRPSPPRRDRERDSRPQVRRGTEPSPLRPLRRQRSLAGRPSNGPQPGSLDNSHRSGRATGNYQDPPTTLLLYRRTAHPLGAPPHFASSKGLALGNPVQWRPGTVARPATPSLTTPRLPLTRHPAH